MGEININQLAQAMERLLASENLRKKFGEADYELVKTHFIRKTQDDFLDKVFIDLC